MSSEAYGANLAGSEFDIVSFIKTPQVVLRMISMLFSVIVFGCILSGGFQYDTCIFNLDNNACGFGVFIGIVSFIAAPVFLLLDAGIQRISNMQHRKAIVISDLATTGFCTFFWFVAFCYLTNRWSNTPEIVLISMAVPQWKNDTVQGAIAFSFFSIPVWGVLSFLAYRNFRNGVTGLFASADEINNQPQPQQVPGSYEGGDVFADHNNTGSYQQDVEEKPKGYNEDIY